jgi:hypothetical protein
LGIGPKYFLRRRLHRRDRSLARDDEQRVIRLVVRLVELLQIVGLRGVEIFDRAARGPRVRMLRERDLEEA